MQILLKTGRSQRPPSAPGARVFVSGLLLLTMLATGCAYYNTFYLAKKFYNQAEDAARKAEQDRRSNGRANELYKKSIEKSQKVIEKYPGSKWQDDAHLLLAKAYYGRGDYLSAERTLRKFPERFADSNLYHEAKFWRGLTAYARAEYPDARRLWEELLQKDPDFKQRDEVEFYLAESRWKEGHDADAVAAFKQFLDTHSRGKYVVQARLTLGRILMDEREYEAAGEMFREVAEHGREETDRLQAQMHLGEALEAQDRDEEALELYNDLALTLDPAIYKWRMSPEERAAFRESLVAAEEEQARQDSLQKAEFGFTVVDTVASEEEVADSQGQVGDPDSLGLAGFDPFAEKPTPVTPPVKKNPLDAKRRDVSDPRDQQIAQVMLREGEVTAKLDRPWEAIEIFQQVLAEFPRTPYAAEAQYRIGYTYEVRLEDFSNAQLAYNEVKNQGASTFRDDAIRRAKNLNTVKALLAQSAGDSLTAAKSAAAEARFMRAELYLFQQENPERALQEYRAIETEFEGTDEAAKAGLAVAWVTAHSLGDSTAAHEKYVEVAAAYPNTEFGRRASRVVYGPEREPEPEEFAGPSVDELTAPENLASIALMREEAEKEAAAASDVAEAAATKTQPEAEKTDAPVETAAAAPEPSTPSPPKAVPPSLPEGSGLAAAVTATTPAAVANSTPPASAPPTSAPASEGTEVAEASPEGTTPQEVSPVEDARGDVEAAAAETGTVVGEDTTPDVPEEPAPRGPAPNRFGDVEVTMQKMETPTSASADAAASGSETPVVTGPNPLSPVEAEGTEAASPKSDVANSPAPARTPEDDKVPGVLLDVPRELYLDPLAIPEDGPTPVETKTRAPARAKKASVDKEGEQEEKTAGKEGAEDKESSNTAKTDPGQQPDAKKSDTKKDDAPPKSGAAKDGSKSADDSKNDSNEGGR